MIDIRIRSLELKETDQYEGLVYDVRTIVSVDGVSMFRTFEVPDPDPANFIPFENITQEVVMNWVKPKVEDQMESIKAQVFQRNKEKEKRGVQVVDPDTGAISYKREDHIPEWEPGMVLEPGDPVYFEWGTVESVDTGEVDESGNPIMEDVTTSHKEFYTTVQGHTTQAGWEPNVVASLFTSNFIFQGEHPTWNQPQGAHDAYPEGFVLKKDGTVYRSLIPANTTEPAQGSQYWEVVSGNVDPPTGPQPWRPYDGTPATIWNTGEQVTHVGSTWTSLVDNNVWEPGSDPTLWEQEVEEGTGGETGGGTTTYPAWEPYDGTPNTLWDIGERVTHNGSTWESLVDNNSWEPGTDPSLWTEVVE